MHSQVKMLEMKEVSSCWSLKGHTSQGHLCSQKRCGVISSFVFVIVTERWFFFGLCLQIIYHCHYFAAKKAKRIEKGKQQQLMDGKYSIHSLLNRMVFRDNMLEDIFGCVIFIGKKILYSEQGLKDMKFVVQGKIQVVSLIPGISLDASY